MVETVLTKDTVAELPNYKHEQFCQCVSLDSVSPAFCYRDAGYAHDPEVAFALLKTKVIAKRIRELIIENARTS